jgi:hypothetical protein
VSTREQAQNVKVIFPILVRGIEINFSISLVGFLRRNRVAGRDRFSKKDAARAVCPCWKCVVGVVLETFFQKRSLRSLPKLEVCCWSRVGEGTTEVHHRGALEKIL